MELLKGEGIEITEPDREPFIEAAQSADDEWGDKVGGRDKIGTQSLILENKMCSVTEKGKGVYGI